MITLFWFMVVITIVVFFHELGHFIFAKLFKTKVEEFAIGMGPKLFSFKGKETEFRFNLIPLGDMSRSPVKNLLMKKAYLTTLIFFTIKNHGKNF
ncbi:site-2 protease family protein [Marinitoga lauensis]|uniref:site-2 protease family protein n=1 Tax=Marinitoga lauensis TaxID=2201189 RepID=UPI001404D5F9|nr:site-2 protease family protein [Marinitoga lauensis]